jgi:DNA-binding response OmpR family regulator
MRALIIESSPTVAKLLKNKFSDRDIILDIVESVDEAEYQTSEFEFEVLVFEALKTGSAGIEFLKQIRKRPNGIPILVTGSNATLDDKRRVFDLGADDFLAKPYEIEELYLRIRALGRRKHGFFGSILEINGLTVNLNAKTCMVKGTPVEFTSAEYTLLEFLLLRRNHLVSRERINRELYRDEKEQHSNVVDVLMSKIRKKLKDQDVDSLIDTVRGEGYTIRQRTP